MGQLIKQDYDNEHYVLIVTIVDSAFSKQALEAAEEMGVEECTVLHGRGKRVGQRGSIFNLSLDLSRDLVFTIAQKDKADTVQEHIYKAVGLKTDGHGLIYQLPVTSLVGVLCGHEEDGGKTDGPPGRHVEGGNG